MTSPKSGVSNKSSSEAEALAVIDEPESDRPERAAPRRGRWWILVLLTSIAAAAIVLWTWLHIAEGAKNDGAIAALADARMAHAQGNLIAAGAAYRRAARNPRTRAEAVATLLAGMLSTDEKQRQRAERLLDNVFPNWPRQQSARLAADRALRMLARLDEPSLRVGMHLLARIRDRRAIEPLLRVYLPPKDMTNYGSDRDQRERPTSRAAREIRAEVLRWLHQIDPTWSSSKEARACVPRFIGALEGDDVLLAAESLGMFGDGRAIGPLARCLLREDETIRRAAAAALAKIDGDWASTPAARELLPVSLVATRDKKRLPVALEVLAVLKSPDVVVPLIDLLAELPTKCAEWEAAVAALAASDAQWRTSEAAAAAAKTYLTVLNETKLVRERKRGAIRVLAALRRREAIAPIIRAVTRTAGGGPVGEGLKALDEIDPDWVKTPEALGELDGIIGLFDKVHYSTQVSAVIRTIGRYRHPKAFAALVKAQLRYSSDARERAAFFLDEQDANWPRSEAFGKLVPKLLKRLDTASSNETRVVRGYEETVRLLCRARDPRVLPRLLEHRRDKYHYRAKAAIDALKQLYKDEPRLILACLLHYDATVRKNAEEALGDVGEAKWWTNRKLTGTIVRDMLAALGGNESVIIEVAARWLGMFGVDEAVEPLVKALGESVVREAVEPLGEPDVRDAVAEALGRLDRVKVLAALRRHVSGGASAVTGPAKNLLNRLAATRPAAP